uniref:Ribosomal RNA-processing protein 12-like conserved domain-containing protein n=1 Tax=Setaria digitata TaxID=48799 RepID=A0A915PH65_9BILA
MQAPQIEQGSRHYPVENFAWRSCLLLDPVNLLGDECLHACPARLLNTLPHETTTPYRFHSPRKPPSRNTSLRAANVQRSRRIVLQRLMVETQTYSNLTITSSESNPSITRHREVAKAVRTFQKVPFISADENYDAESKNGDMMLQQIPLHKLQIGDVEVEETKSMTSSFSERNSMESELSQFTSCTNPTFDPVHRLWRSGSVLQKEVVAVLAATAELIKDNSGIESDTEYFAALLTVIEATPTSDESRLAAAAYLLGLVAKKVDKSILCKCFSRAHEILEKKLDSTQLDVALTKLIIALGTILHRQATNIWHSSNTRLSLVKLEIFATHNKSVVRSAARRILRMILSDPVKITSSGCHPAAGVVGEFLIKQLEQSTANVDIDVLLRLLCLAGSIMHKMPPVIFKKFAESIFALLPISNSNLRCAVFQCFQKILQQQPADSVLPFSTNVILTDTLLNFGSTTTDPFVICSWMEALCESHLCLATKDLIKSIATLKTSLKPIFQTFDFGRDSVAMITYKIICRLAEHCTQSNEELASYMINLCDEALNPRSIAVWQYVLRTEARIFEICKTAISSRSLERALKTLAGLRSDINQRITPDIDLAVGAAVRYIGAESVLRVLPLELDPQNVSLVTHFERSWLIPILRVNICNQPINFALNYFLPLAHQLQKKAPSDDVGRKTFITISGQLWDLLPNLLSSATDFMQNFPHLAEILGKVLVEQRSLRLIVLSSLRSALRYALQPDAPEERKDVMRLLAYSFLRKLFTLYTVSNVTMESAEGTTGNSLKTLRCSVLETIRIYMNLTPNDVIDNFINLAIEKSQIKGMALDQKVRILDLMAALAKKGSVSGLNNIFSVIHPLFTTSEVVLQKKAFRILEEIMKRSDDGAVTDFFTSNADEINNIFDQDLDSISKSARAALVAVYFVKLSSLASFEDAEVFGKKFLPRIIVCLDKSHNIRTRSNALKCFVKLCQQLILFGSNERSATIALNATAQKFTRILDASLLNRLIAHACSWIDDERPVIRVLVIRLLRMLAKKLPDYTMQQYQNIRNNMTYHFPGTAAVSCVRRRRCERRNGTKVKDNDRNKYDHYKTSVVTSARTACADTILNTIYDSDSESEIEDRESIGGRTRGSSVWLKNDDDEDVMDLLDRNKILKKIATVRSDPPYDEKPLKLDNSDDEFSDFEMAKDGRLIIKDLDINEKDKRKRKRFEKLLKIPDKKMKTQNNSKSDDGSDDGNSSKAINQNVGWTSGGKGIHRNVCKGVTSDNVLKRSAGNVRKKNQKYEPYIYIPISKSRRQKTELKKLIKGARKGAATDAQRKIRR